MSASNILLLSEKLLKQYRMKYDIAYKRDMTLLKIAFDGQLWALMVLLKGLELVSWPHLWMETS